MKVGHRHEESIGAVIAYLPSLKTSPANSDIKSIDQEFLLLKGPKGVWNFTKGHKESGETDYDTIRREIFEETGITAYKIISYIDKIKYRFFNNNGHSINKQVKFYYIITNTYNVVLSNEHIDYAWLVYAQARALLTFNQSKFILEKVRKYRSF
jgi:bis(5'-nucleosidyl)-tetraphosphatase